MDHSSESKKKIKKPKDRSIPRVYDKDGYRKRVDCVIYRDRRLKEVLLVSSRGSEDCWTIPGGGIELNETPATAAVREAHEEGGVVCEAIESIGIFEDKERTTRTEAFILIVLSQDHTWRDKEEWGRGRQWFTVQETVDILYEREKYDKIAYFPNILPKTPPSSLKLDTPPYIGTSTNNGLISLAIDRNILSSTD